MSPCSAGRDPLPVPRVRVAAALARAPRVYPGAPGDAIVDAIVAWRDGGYRFGSSRFWARLFDDILRKPLPLEGKP